MNGLERALLNAEMITAVHEEALASLDEYDSGYHDLRAATATRVLVEYHLAEFIEDVESDVRNAVPVRHVNAPCQVIPLFGEPVAS